MPSLAIFEEVLAGVKFRLGLIGPIGPPARGMVGGV